MRETWIYSLVCMWNLDSLKLRFARNCSHTPCGLVGNLFRSAAVWIRRFAGCDRRLHTRSKQFDTCQRYHTVQVIQRTMRIWPLGLDLSLAAAVCLSGRAVASEMKLRSSYFLKSTAPVTSQLWIHSNDVWEQYIMVYLANTISVLAGCRSSLEVRTRVIGCLYKGGTTPGYWLGRY